jgi:hypothetical protein
MPHRGQYLICCIVVIPWASRAITDLVHMSPENGKIAKIDNDAASSTIAYLLLWYM